MKMKKSFSLAILALMVFSPPSPAALAGPVSPPLKETRAFRRYVEGPHSDLAKLLCLIDRFRDTDVQVIYQGHPYDARTAIEFARDYLARNYRKERPDRWIKANVTLRGFDGKMPEFKFSNGKTRVVVDVLLEELNLLYQTEGKKDP